MKRISVLLTPQQYAALKRKKRETGLAQTDLVRRAVEQYLAAQKTSKRK